MFADLHAELDELPEIAVVAVGGLPIVRDGQVYTLFGAVVDEDSLRSAMRAGLGLGAVLTFRNRGKKSLEELAALSIDNGHLWATHVLSLTLAFARCPLAVRNAFAFDRRFHLSWVDDEIDTSPCTFTATGSVREWTRIIAYSEEPSFRAAPRAWFAKTGVLLAPLLR